ncbi:hypothetical protein K0M31_016838 [Melipona bicolor]|uniref:Uncharacterized protein n=1 Tax=Melipona bicolor TaxID=60889 RepID=A0AA40KEI6_9HYME|nr:hypothetical protein K0M31_016838 [Melipona bicolor]
MQRYRTSAWKAQKQEDSPLKRKKNERKKRAIRANFFKKVDGEGVETRSFQFGALRNSLLNGSSTRSENRFGKPVFAKLSSLPPFSNRMKTQTVCAETKTMKTDPRERVGRAFDASVEELRAAGRIVRFGNENGAGNAWNWGDRKKLRSLAQFRQVGSADSIHSGFHHGTRDGEEPNEHSSENSETDVIQRIPRADCSTGEASVSEGSLGQRERPVSTENSSSSESSPIQHNVRKRPRLTFD